MEIEYFPELEMGQINHDVSHKFCTINVYKDYYDVIIFKKKRSNNNKVEEHF